MGPTPATIPDTHLDLAVGAFVGVLSTMGPDGLLQSTAVWYWYDEGVFKMTMIGSRQKAINAGRYEHATLFIFDPEGNFWRSLEVRGDVTVVDDTDLSVMHTVVTRYGRDSSTCPALRDDRVILTVIPRKVTVFG